MANKLTLQTALLYYTGSDPDTSEPINYWQIHPIAHSPEGLPQLKEGHPIEMKELESLCKATSPNLIRNIGWIDPMLLAYGAGSEGPLVFFRPEVRRPIYFGRQTSLKSGVVLWPSLVLVAFSRRLHVFAAKGAKRPTRSTPLLMAPFHNVDGNHEVCLGSSRAPRACRPQDMGAWAEAFYTSSFTHLNAPDNQLLKKGTLENLWGDLLSGAGKRSAVKISFQAKIYGVPLIFRARAYFKRFPYRLLKPAGINLGELLKRIGLDEHKR